MKAGSLTNYHTKLTSAVISESQLLGPILRLGVQF